MAVVTRRALVRGRVQGVGYRMACAREARRLGLGGHARNLADGTVEVLATGPADAVARLLEWCRTGPPGAVVSDVAVGEAVPDEGDGAGGAGRRGLEVGGPPGSFRVG